MRFRHPRGNGYPYSRDFPYSMSPIHLTKDWVNNTSKSDERILKQAYDVLRQEAHISACEVELDVNDGEVTLFGTVETPEAKKAAADALDRIPGVRRVDNLLRILVSSAESIRPSRH